MTITIEPEDICVPDGEFGADAKMIACVIFNILKRRVPHLHLQVVVAAATPNKLGEEEAVIGILHVSPSTEVITELYPHQYTNGRWIRHVEELIHDLKSQPVERIIEP